MSVVVAFLLSPRHNSIQHIPPLTLPLLVAEFYIASDCYHLQLVVVLLLLLVVVVVVEVCSPCRAIYLEVTVSVSLYPLLLFVLLLNWKRPATFSLARQYGSHRQA